MQVKKLRHNGKRHDIDPRMARLAVVGALNWLPKWHNPAGHLAADEVAVQFDRLFVYGLKPGYGCPGLQNSIVFLGTFRADHDRTGPDRMGTATGSVWRSLKRAGAQLFKINRVQEHAARHNAGHCVQRAKAEQRI